MTCPGERGADSTSAAGTAPRAWLTVVGVLLVALNMRIAVAVVSPLVPDIRGDLELSRGTASMLTTLPVLCFGLLSVAASSFAQRLGNERTMLLGLVGLALGSALRFLPATGWLLLGTVLVGAALATVNVLMPSIVKQYFARGSAVLTGGYTAALTAGAASAAASSAPLAHGAGIGWHGVLLVVAVPALVAAAFWLPQLRRPKQPPQRRGTGVLRSGITWALAIQMGAQSLLYYGVLAWLPSYLHGEGVTTTNAGIALALFNLAGMVGSIAVSPIAARLRSQVPVVLVTCLAWGATLAGLYFVPDLYLVWSALGGMVQGACISLALTLIMLRARTPEVATSLSGAVQSVGYLIASTGPLIVGTLRDATAGWGVPMLCLGGAVLAMAAAAPWTGRPRQVG